MSVPNRRFIEPGIVLKPRPKIGSRVEPPKVVEAEGKDEDVAPVKRGTKTAQQLLREMKEKRAKEAEEKEEAGPGLFPTREQVMSEKSVDRLLKYATSVGIKSAKKKFTGVGMMDRLRTAIAEEL
jgi:hypothetical protein